MSALERAGAWRAVRLDVVALTILGVLAVIPLDTLFDTHNALVLGGGAAVLAVAVNVLLRRASLWTSALVSAAALAAYLTFVVFEVGVPDDSALRTVWTDTTASWADLITAPVPSDPLPHLVAFPVVLAWLGTQVGTLLALRTRWITVPVVGPLAALLVALLYTGAHSTPRFAFVAVFALVVLVVALLRANAEPRLVTAPGGHGGSGSSGPLRLGIAVIGTAAVLAAAVGLAAPVTSVSERADLHDRYEPPFDLSETVSPLSQLRAGLDDHAGEPLLTVVFPNLPDGVEVDHVDTAVLTTYDGIVWGTDATFGRAGRQLPVDPSPADGTIAVDQHYELTDYRSPFLPFVGRPSTLRADDLGFDRRTGMLVGAPGSREPRRYDVTSLLPTSSGDDAKAAAPAGADPDLVALIASPPSGWPAELVQLADELPTTASPYEDFLALEADMQSNRYGYNEESRPGHSLKVLVDFLNASTGGDGVESARIGYAEQFASAFAVLARIKGYPSRVVVGYRIDAALAASGEPVEVRPNDVTAWPEVHLRGAGWVRFDPTNEIPREPDATEPPPPPVNGPVTETTQAPVDNTAPPAGGQGESGEQHGSMPIWPLLFVAAGVGLLVSIPAAKMLLRRRRRAQSTAAGRTRGAWLQTRDLLRCHGVAVSPAATVCEVADGADEKLAPTLRQFGPLVDQLLYAPSAPTDDAAASAWDIEREMSELIATEYGVRTRAKALFDPRPLADAARRRSAPIGDRVAH